MNLRSGKDLAGNIARLCDRFFTWWIQELISFVPAKWRRNEQARIEARRDNEGFALTVTRPPKVMGEARLYRGRVEPHDFSANAAIRDERLLVWLFPSEESILARRVQIPTSAATRFERLLGLEMDRWSPYKLDEVYAIWDELKTEHAARRDIDLRLIPRSLVQGWCAELAAAGLSPSFLALGTASRHLIDLRPRSSRLIRARVISICASVLLVVGAVGADWFAAANELESWRGGYREQVRLFASQRNLEERISRAVTSVEQTGRSFSKGRLMADLAAALPDTDWLTEIAIKNQNLTLRGYAVNLDRLIKALEPLATDRNISLQGEVAFDGTTNRQRFTVTFRPAGV